MLIVQITDIHIGFDQKSRFEMNKKRFRQTVQAVKKLEPKPDLIVITGDIADKGDVASYEWFRQEIQQLSLPILMCMGNHDSRASFSQVFPDTAQEDGFIQYVVDDHPCGSWWWTPWRKAAMAAASARSGRPGWRPVWPRRHTGQPF